MTLGLIGTRAGALVTHACHYQSIIMSAGIHDTLSDVTPALSNKNKEQKKDTDELIKLWRQLVQPNCPNKLGPFIVNSLNEFRRVIWLHLHK